MLKISRKVEYALIALRHFHGQDMGKLTSAKELAQTYGVPQELLAKVLPVSYTHLTLPTKRIV